MATKIRLIQISDNKKTGAIPTTYNSRSTCPQSCPHYDTSCYAHAGFYTRLAWDRVDTNGANVDALCEQIKRFPKRQLWRYGVAGDLPGAGELVHDDELEKIVDANRGRRGFTFSHKKQPQAIAAIKRANAGGFSVNISADNLSEADDLARHNVPLVVLLPIDSPKTLKTPGGLSVRVCPAQVHDDVTCSTCGVCQVRDRKHVVGFLAHGARKKHADKISKIQVVSL